MTPSEVYVNYKNRGNIEVTSASAPYSAQIHAKLALVTEKYVHSTCTIRTTCPHSSGSEMSSAALTAILTAARKHGITTILWQTNENDETTCQINKTLIYTFCRVPLRTKKYQIVMLINRKYIL